MPSQVTVYRVFIASPKGLEEERKRFRDAINEYNERDALEGGVLFIPVGWEFSLPGMGRPQELINEELRRCDYCVLLLHDRWGSVPAVGPAPYSSGTEEEYALARQLLIARSMLNLVIYFKDLEPERLRDAGPQLQKVLDFKRKLEEEKELFFQTYADPAEFDKRLNRHLASWLRDHARRAAAGGSV